MKIKPLFVALFLMAGVVVAPTANASEKPTVESFTFTPQEIELSAESTTISFELVASHPFGIATSSITVTLTNSRNDVLATVLTRADSMQLITKATYKGSLTVPRNINAGLYLVSASTIKNNSSAGYEYGTGIIEGGKVRTLVGAENGLLVRSGGDLNFDYATFVGPSHDASLGIAYNDPVKFSPLNKPIWKVGETYDPTKFYEIRVPSLSLTLKSSTPTVCSSDGKILSMLKEGSCSFIVSTPKTKDYLERLSPQSFNITAARIKPILSIDKISNQDVKDLGNSISIGKVFSVSEGYVLPYSTTPSVCFTSGFYVKLIAGGTCSLVYQTAATSTYLASEIYTQTFEILKDGKPVAVPTPVATPTPTATPTAKPVVKKTITCVKGKKSVKKTAISPKCPAGYKVKK